jgi:acetyl esterase/lipase
MAQNGPVPDAHIPYGDAPSQYVEFFKPVGRGPFPVVVLVHGGCWASTLGGIVQMRNIAGALIGQGIAVWSVEYRRLDEEGGGYPGTLQDMNAALGSLVAKASDYHLDTARLVAMGHSAGGYLVQWMAGRTRLPESSPLYIADPLPIREVISLGGLADLRRQKDRIKNVCDVDVADLTGPPSATRPDVYADSSGAELIPNGSHTVLINGELDTISPPGVALAYARRALDAGDRAEVLVLPGASHFDEVVTTSESWKLILPVILKGLGRGAL